MALAVNLDGVRQTYRLCFVRAPWAYFTRLPVRGQWGDGWETAPYQTHSGPPYDDSPDQILRVAFDGPLFTPEAGRDGIAVSAQALNEGAFPWLRTESAAGGPPLHIMGGTMLGTFVEAVELAGGRVYAPIGWGELPVGLPEFRQSEA